MGKHTTGPWIVEQSAKTPIYVSPLDCREYVSICQVLVIDEDEQSDGGEWINGDQTKANACLIAAAPDLLEALEACASSLGAVSPGGNTDPDVVRARAAIAKAKGV